jgi:hypothetical protein
MGGRSHQQPSLGGGPLKVAACRVAAAAGESSTGFLPLLGWIILAACSKAATRNHFRFASAAWPSLYVLNRNRYASSQHQLGPQPCTWVICRPAVAVGTLNTAAPARYYVLTYIVMPTAPTQSSAWSSGPPAAAAALRVYRAPSPLRGPSPCIHSLLAYQQRLPVPKPCILVSNRSAAAAAALAPSPLQHPLLHDSKQVLPPSAAGWVSCMTLALRWVDLDVA